jgi:hypothetical protein
MTCVLSYMSLSLTQANDINEKGTLSGDMDEIILE